MFIIIPTYAQIKIIFNVKINIKITLLICAHFCKIINNKIFEE